MVRKKLELYLFILLKDMTVLFPFLMGNIRVIKVFLGSISMISFISDVIGELFFAPMIAEDELRMQTLEQQVLKGCSYEE